MINHGRRFVWALVVCAGTIGHAIAGAEGPISQYRFSWEGAFDRRIDVVITMLEDGTSNVSATIQDEPETTRFTQLSVPQTAELVREIERSGFWTMPSTSPCTGCRDGATWTVKGENQGKRHTVARWSPSGGPFWHLGTSFIRASGLKVSHELY